MFYVTSPQILKRRSKILGWIIFALGFLLVYHTVTDDTSSNSGGTGSNEDRGTQRPSYLTTASPSLSRNVRTIQNSPEDAQRKVYEDRKKRINDVCSAVDIANFTYSLDNKLFFEKQNVLYCGNLKVGTTFMDGFLPHIFKCGNHTEECYYRPLFSGKSQITAYMDRAFSFTVVRDPYERLFSGYENKLYLPNKFWKTLGRDVVATVRKDALWLSVVFGYDVTFRELVEYVVMKNDDDLNAHLMPMFKLCNPCQGRFDFVGKLESMNDDMNYLVKTLADKGFVEKNTTAAFDVAADVRDKQLLGPVHHLFSEVMWYLKKYLKYVKGSNFNRTNLFLRTWRSYQIRGYILKDIPMPFTSADHVTHDIYADTVRDAVRKSALNKPALKAQRTEALLQAYRTIPLDLMKKLRKFVEKDCILFGYDDRPSRLYNKLNETNTVFNDGEFNYFDGL